MYVITRGDLHMSGGKLASQAGHAFKMLTKQLHDDTELFNNYFADGDIGTNVVLRAKNLNQILLAHDKALAAGIPCSLISDQGHIMPPHFDGKPIITALGIGPATRDDIQHITKRFNLEK